MWPLLSMLVTLPPRAARQACTGRARATPRFGRARASPPTTVVSIYSRDDEPDIPRGGRPTAVAAALCVCRMCVRVLSHVDPVVGFIRRSSFSMTVTFPHHTCV